MQRDSWYFILPIIALVVSTLFYISFINSFHHFGVEGNRMNAILQLYPVIPPGSILFLGESQVREDIDCHQIDAVSGDTNCFNLGLGGILPLQLALQKELIIEAKPKLVVIGVSSVFFDETTNKNDDLFMLLGQDSRTASDAYLLGLLSDEEKNLLTMNWYERALYNRKFILPWFFSLFHTGARNSDQSFNVSAIYDFKNPHFFMTADSFAELLQRISDPKLKTIFEIESSSTRERSAFVYLLKELQEAKVSVVIIKMPVHPLVLQEVPQASQDAFDQFILNTAQTFGAKVVNYENAYNAEYFNDLTHLTAQGQEKFTQDLIRGDSYFIQ